MPRALLSKATIALAAAIGLVALSAGAGWTQGPKVVARPLTPQEIHDYGLPEGTQKSGGLFTVGVGAPVYLEALVDKGQGAGASVTWALGSKPRNSTAALAGSPLGAAIPIYSPGDREVYDVAGRQLLVPDKVGQYTVSATVTTDEGVTTVTQVVTAANTVGVGTVGGAEPEFPQCAVCHEDKAGTWASTRHATKLERELDGQGSSQYAAACIECHSVGYDAAAAASNSGFDDVARDTGWSFPGTLQAGNFAAMPAELQAVSNIQCESCHGPGSEHKGDPEKISVSLSAGDCAQCHDEQPLYTKNTEWAASMHAVTTRTPTGEGREACIGCHTGIGFIERMKGLEPSTTDYEAITCQACHDPHDAANPKELRTVGDVTLENGRVISVGGTGKLCMNCHHSRRNAETYAAEYHSNFGPHGSPQADMLAGTNAIEYGQQIASSPHINAVGDACASCHMQSLALDHPASTQAGGHTFKTSWDAGTPDNPSDDVDLTGACAQCHGQISSFDIPTRDYDGDRLVEGVQTEVAGLMSILALALPPVGEPTVEVTQDYNPQMLKAAYNYLFVQNDGSMGVHNAKYAVGILKVAIKDLTGRDIVTAVEVLSGAERVVPTAFGLAQNTPNPFNPETEIRYAVPRASDIQIAIYNSLGQLVRDLVGAHHTAGEYKVAWDGEDSAGQKVTGGVYLYTMRAGSFQQTRKMVLLP